ncbi:MAG: hypothetical protein RBU37_02710 [Myxococcota bacterium]|jgi:hypothetical protein|nr:hypothetical protein [Myxococcota bacterium]
MTMDEQRLIERLMAVEALFAGASCEGEKVAAERARERILERLRAFEAKEAPTEFRFRIDDPWSRKVFIALLRRYGIRPYRYPRQHSNTVMARVPQRFVNETLWPEYEALSRELATYLNDVTQRVVAKVLHEDTQEAETVSSPLPLT